MRLWGFDKMNRIDRMLALCGGLDFVDLVWKIAVDWGSGCPAKFFDRIETGCPGIRWTVKRWFQGWTFPVFGLWSGDQISKAQRSTPNIQVIIRRWGPFRWGSEPETTGRHRDRRSSGTYDGAKGLLPVPLGKLVFSLFPHCHYFQIIGSEWYGWKSG